MNKKKIAILLPDGVGLRNFVYADIPQDEGKTYYFWTPLQLDQFKYPTQRLPIAKNQGFISILQQVKTHLESFIYYKQFKNDAYLLYGNKKQCYKWNSFRAVVTSLFKIIGRTFFASGSGWLLWNKMLLTCVRGTKYYRACKRQLQVAQPDFVFNTTQRLVQTIAPMLAAQDLGIKTGTFVYSWDNLPKGGGLVCPADNVYVWSDYMKQEMAKYYPFYVQSRVFVTGTPQFISYFDAHRKLSRKEFCEKQGLDQTKKFICFSGDDVSTSPYDAYYLRDIAQAVRAESSFHIIFRRCPVDRSARYDWVLSEYSDVITSIDPLWKVVDRGWQGVVATDEDLTLLVNTVLHSAVVVNVGSTMGLDFSIFDKPACYLRYNVQECNPLRWNVHTIYKYIHFRTMDGLDPIYWIDSSDSICDVLKDAIDDKQQKIPQAKLWLKRVAKEPLKESNARLWAEIDRTICM